MTTQIPTLAALSAGVEQFPAGAVVAFAGASAPSGWMICNGAAISRTTYATLFTAISTTYGVGDGSTTFNIPDITGRVIAGKEASATNLTTPVDGSVLGDTGGDEAATAPLPAHTHSYDGVNANVSDVQNGTGTAPAAYQTGLTTGSAGSLAVLITTCSLLSSLTTSSRRKVIQCPT
jgi:microcystin-dependent protein